MPACCQQRARATPPSARLATPRRLPRAHRARPARAAASILCSESTGALVLLYLGYARNIPQFYPFAAVAGLITVVAWADMQGFLSAAPPAAPKTRGRKTA